MPACIIDSVGSRQGDLLEVNLIKKLDVFGLRIALLIMLFIGIEYVSRSLDHIMAWIWVKFSLPMSRMSLEFLLWFIEFGPVVLWSIYAVVFIQILKLKHFEGSALE